MPELSTMSFLKSNNLSDVSDKAAARTNLGISSGLGVISANTTLYIATNGNDSRTFAEAQNVSTPWLTLQKALTALNVYWIDPSKMVTIQLGSGTFAQNAALRFYHPSSNRIYIIGTSSAANSNAITAANTTTLDWTGIASDGVSIDDTSSAIGVLSRLYLKGGSSGSKNSGYGLSIGGGSRITLGSLVRVEYWTYGALVQNNATLISNGSAFCNNANDGICILDGSFVQLSGGYLSGNGSAGLMTYEGRALIQNSVISSNTSWGLYAYCNSGFRTAGNTFSGNGSGNYSPAANVLGNSNSYIQA